MRALLLTLALLAASCGGASDPKNEAPGGRDADWPQDGFLRFLPADLSVTVRAPSMTTRDANPGAVTALLRALGRPRSIWSGKGIDPSRSAGLAITTAGARVHYLPALDKAAINRDLGDRVKTMAYREEQDWVILSQGGTGAGSAQGDPLPPGDAALRVRHHRLLDIAFGSGDTLELGLTLGGGGIDFSGRLRPAESSATSLRLATATPLADEILDLLPPVLAVRVETTLPASELAAPLTRRLAKHCGIAAEKDRVLIERFLRELLTGMDSSRGWGLGLDFKDGALSAIILGHKASGPPSPLLAGVRQRRRSSVGPLVLDFRNGAPRNSLGFWAWVVEARPAIEGLPETAWGAVARLSNEQDGLRVAFTRVGNFVACAVGPRADLMLKSTRRRLAGAASRSPAVRALRAARGRVQDAPYVLGVALRGAGFSGLAESDRKAIAALVGAGGEAQVPGLAAFAGFLRDGGLWIEGRLLY